LNLVRPPPTNDCEIVCSTEATAVERDAEIDQIKRERGVLRSRHAPYRRAAAAMKTISMVLIPLCGVAAAVFAVKLFPFDSLYGVFFLGAPAILVAAVTWFTRSLDLRWIDFVSHYARGIYSPYFFTPDTPRSQRARNDAQMIEWQIADRERRLAELGADAPGSAG
jgi:hypothetical protein